MHRRLVLVLLVPRWQEEQRCFTDGATNEMPRLALLMERGHVALSFLCLLVSACGFLPGSFEPFSNSFVPLEDTCVIVCSHYIYRWLPLFPVSQAGLTLVLLLRWRGGAVAGAVLADKTQPCLAC